MLLSSVALVAKPKNAKSKDSDRKAEVLTNYLQGDSDTCVDCQKEVRVYLILKLEHVLTDF
jgi:hypothetical protein